MAEPTKQNPSLRARLETDLANSDCEGGEIRAATLRLIMCAVHDRDADARAHDQCKGCDDSVIQDVLRLMIRQREESAEKYETVGHFDLADNEREEIEVIKGYLPPPLDDDALNKVVSNVITDLDAQSLKDLGRCMNELKTRYPGEIDSRKAGKLVKKALCS